MEAIREPAVAGMFYPASENKLRDQLELLFDITSEEKKYKNVFGLIAPHAGYVYSGKTAAYGYSAVSGNKYKRAIIISPSHREYFPGISVYEGDSYKTPMGIVEVDNELREKFITGSKTIYSGSEGHRAEHALEVHLPFLQFLYPDLKILPVVIGDQSTPSPGPHRQRGFVDPPTTSGKDKKNRADSTDDDTDTGEFSLSLVEKVAALQSAKQKKSRNFKYKSALAKHQTRKQREAQAEYAHGGWRQRDPETYRPSSPQSKHAVYHGHSPRWNSTQKTVSSKSTTASSSVSDSDYYPQAEAY